MSDPFGLTSFGVADLLERPGVKWSRPAGRIASWIADMDFPVAPAIVERLRHRAAVDVGYPDWDELGRSPLCRRFAERMADRFGWDVDVDRLHELADVLQGVATTVHHLTAPGDGIVLHVPAYPPFLGLISTSGRTLVEVPAADGADGYAWDYDELDVLLKSLAGAPGAPRLWLLCHPQNPLGRVFARSELERIAELALRHDLVVVSDEIHAELVHDGHVHVPFASLGSDVAARTVTVTSSSKAFNLAGLRWAILHAGDRRLHDALRSLPSHYLGTPNLMAVEATDAAWTAGDEWLTAVRRVLDDNRHLLGALLRRHLPEVRYDVPQATYLAWLDCRGLGLGDDPAAVFRQRGVELAPGPNFGTGGAGCARLNVATSPTVLEQLVVRMVG